MQLYNSSWTTTVASSTGRMQQREKLNKQICLPLVDDLVKLTTFVKKELLKEEYYTRLQKLVLASLLLFNKRRPVEVANIKIADYKVALECSEDREEIMDQLCPEEKAVAESYYSIIFVTCHILFQIK